MQTTTYKCDRCGAEDTTNALALQEVTVGLRHQQYGYSAGMYTSDDSRATRPAVQWCRACLLETGVISPQRAGVNPPPAPTPIPSLEDMVREIVREELAQVQQ